MILWNALIEPKLIEQTPLLATSPHHRRLHRDPQNLWNHCSATFSSLFRQHRSLADIGQSKPDVGFSTRVGRANVSPRLANPVSAGKIRILKIPNRRPRAKNL